MNLQQDTLPTSTLVCLVSQNKFIWEPKKRSVDHKYYNLSIIQQIFNAFTFRGVNLDYSCQ